MLCKRCGRETPEGSAYCENCGLSLESQVAFETADDSDLLANDEAPSEQDGRFAQGSPLEWGTAFEPLEVIEPEESFVEVKPSDYVHNEWDKTRYVGPVPAMGADELPFEGESLVDLPTPPEEFRLDRKRVAVVGVISVLFAAVLVLLACAVVLRLFGL